MTSPQKWLRRWFRRTDELHEEIAEELRFHIELKTDELVRRGMPLALAKQSAEESFGSRTRIAEAGHDVRGNIVLEEIAADIRFALRLLGKRPARTMVLIATLALGIGFNTAVFAVVHSVFIQPLPFPKAEELVVLHQANHGARSGVSYPHFQDWQSGSRCFTELAVFGSASAILTGAGDPAVISGATVSSGIFRVSEVAPVRGRLFRAEEDRWAAGSHTASPVLISERLWRSRFNAREEVLGRLIRLNSREYSVIGIIPSKLSFPIGKDPVDYWTTVAVDADPLLYGGSIPTSRGYPRYDGVIARLKPGVSLPRARAEMASLASVIAKEHPHATSADQVLLLPILEEVVGSASRTMISLLYGGVFCVLLVACVNVTTILLVDTLARRREFSLRSALGAPVYKLIRQLLVEATVLASAGCMLSFAVAAVALHLFVVLAPPETPRLEDIRLGSAALWYAPALSFLAGLLFGCLPAISTRKHNPAHALRDGAQPAARTRLGIPAGQMLICGQIAMSMLLTCSAVMLITSFASILQSPRGFNQHKLLTASLSLPIATYGQASPRVGAFYDDLLRNLRTLPGVSSATLAEVLPLSGDSNNTTIEIAGDHEPGMRGVDLRFIDSEYFTTLQIPLRVGRVFATGDTAGRPACAVVNEAFVHRFLQGRNPLTTSLQLGWGGKGAKRIIGVVADVRPTATSAATSPEVYVPLSQFPLNDVSVLIRSSGSPEALAAPLRKTVQQLDPAVPLDRVRSLEDYLLLSSAPQHFLMWVLLTFAVAAVLLSAVGIYGVLGDAALSRTHEFGIRLALGATRWQVTRLVLERGLVVAAVGLLIGSALTLWSLRILQNWLYDPGFLTPSPFLQSAACLVVIVLATGAIPARRAAAIDPATSLRMN